ncbi:hypothetical protein D3C73_1402890 [compost metagenome]
MGDRGYDADWFRGALQAKGITPCIPGRKSRTEPIRYNKRRYKRRNRIEIMLAATRRPAGRPAQRLAARRHPLRPMP